MKAPPHQDVYVAFSGFGMLQGGVAASKARLWLIAASADPDAEIIARYAVNGPGGHPEYHDLGPVTSVRSTNKNTAIQLASGRSFVLILAPCVCGAGAIGHAMPYDGRVRVQNVVASAFKVFA